MRSVRVLEPAAAEAVEAAAWYESHRPGLGADFREEFGLALEMLREGPVPGKTWPGRLGQRRVKRFTMKRFPFFVVFVNIRSEAVVLAIAHHRRRPGYWRDRIPRTMG